MVKNPSGRRKRAKTLSIDRAKSLIFGASKPHYSGGFVRGNTMDSMVCTLLPEESRGLVCLPNGSLTACGFMAY